MCWLYHTKSSKKICKFCWNTSHRPICCMTCGHSDIKLRPSKNDWTGPEKGTWTNLCPGWFGVRKRSLRRNEPNERNEDLIWWFSLYRSDPSKSFPIRRRSLATNRWSNICRSDWSTMLRRQKRSCEGIRRSSTAVCPKWVIRSVRELSFTAFRFGATVSGEGDARLFVRCWVRTGWLCSNAKSI